MAKLIEKIGYGLGDAAAGGITWKVMSIAFPLFFFSLVSLAQRDGGDPFNKYYDIQAPVESFKMNQYGNLSPNLHTGAMSFSVPIFTYSDPDFTIPLSFDYSFNGYRPAQSSGSIGYGWILNCGGVITREVRGIPDDSYHGYWSGAKYGRYTDFKNSYFLGSSVMSIDTYHWPGESSFEDYDIFADGPTWNNYDGMETGNYEHYDSAPDIFHFSAPGLHGDFVMLSNGEFKVFNSSCPSGELSVSLVSSYYANLPETAQLVITDGRGFRYEFGGNQKSIEYSFLTQDSETTEAAVSWRLRRIVAPNGRVAEFCYTDRPDRSVSFPDRFIPWNNKGINHDFYSHSVSEGSILLLSDVKVDGHSIYSFGYTPRGSSNNEFAPGCFRCPLAQSYVTHYPPELVTPYSPRRLSSVSVKGCDGSSLRNVSLSVTYAGQARKMFLREVDMGSLGRYTFSYDNQSLAGPKNDTYQTDHWGFWNSADREIDYTLGPEVYDRTFEGLYWQLPDSLKRPDTARTLYGSLTGIVYPTGGSTGIAYEQNDVSTLFDRGKGFNPLYHSSHDGFVPGGCRVKSLIHSSQEFRDTVSYSYLTTLSKSSGTLYSMPRYFLSASVLIAIVRQIGHEPTFYQIPHQLYAGESFTFNTYTFTYETDFKLPRGPIVGYSHIRETHSGGWRKEYQFSNQEDFPDIYYPHGWENEDDFVTFWYKFCFSPNDYVHVGNNETSGPESYAKLLLPPLRDFSSMRGLLLSESEYDAGGKLVRSDTYDYSAVEAFRDTISTNVIVAYAKHTDAYFEPRLTRKVSSDHGNSITTTFMYYPNGQEMRRTVSYEDGYADIRHTWYQSFPYGSNASLRSSPSFISHVRKPSGSSNLYLLDVTQFEYSSDSQNPSPTSVTVSRSAVPAQVNSSPASFHYVPAGYTSRSASLTYDDTNYRLEKAILPGNSKVWYSWDSEGRHVLTKAVGDTLNKWTFTWRDQCGPLSVKEPSGVLSHYTYDSCGRLTGSYDSGWSPVTTASFGIATTNNPPLQGRSLNRITTITYTSSQGSAYTTEEDWFGGLGYLIQHVDSPEQGSGISTLVTPIVYDELRRDDATVYLPFATHEYNGGYVENDTSLQMQWYDDIDARPWRENIYEQSPSGRLLHSRREGLAHYLAGAQISIDYDFNEEADSVLTFTFSRTSQSESSCSVTRSGIHFGGRLLKTRRINEDGDTSFVFTDRRGRKILDRKLCNGVRHDTYYVLDIRDSVACIIQQEGASRLSSGIVSSFSFTDSFAEDYCFTRLYDNWGCLIREGIPCAGYTERTFDSRGFVYLEKDRSLSAVSGMRQYIRDQRGRLTSLYYSRSQGTNAPYTAISNAYWKATTDASGFTPVSGVVTASDLCTTECCGLIFKEVVRESPVKSPGASVHTAPPGGVSVTRYHYYGKKARLIQTKEVWSDGWTSLYSYKYDFPGRITISDERHIPPSGMTHYKRVTYSYDGRGRLDLVSIAVDNGTLSMRYVYDDLGRLVSVRSGNGLLTENYSYNICGFETGHSAYYSGSGSGEAVPVFKKRYLYADGDSPRYGGDVSEIRTFLYGTDSLSQNCTYDHVGRLVSSTAVKSSSGVTFAGESVIYDRNGNITAVSRNGIGIPSSSLSLQRGGNRITGVHDNLTGGDYTYLFDDDGRLIYDSRAGRHITYHNGNGTPMTVSDSEGTLLARYHYLEDGTKVSVLRPDGSGVKYRGSFIYDVSVSGNETLDRVSYESGHFLKTGGVTVPPKPVHYIKDRVGSFSLALDLYGGSASGAPSVRERNYYLPYGVHSSSPGFAGDATSRWRYASKEEQSSVSGLPYLDFGPRLYDTFTCSWTTPDALASSSPGASPYSYCFGNPLGYVDRDGHFPDALWDAFNVALDATSLVNNIRGKQWKSAAVDAGGLILDVAAVALPFVPGGAGSLIKVARTGDKTYDMAEWLQRGRETEKRVLEANGYVKNTKKFSAKTLKGQPINVIPDAVTESALVEIKDVKYLPNTKQLQGELDAAQSIKHDFILYIGKDTKISGPLQDKINKEEIILHRDELIDYISW